ncbi:MULTISPECIES: DUF7288 family protein [unclassified Archaeoglobus]|uniref:DUF7288 family protein n=1 Tax=unclassified Archaeoglobus TaxID=2643606 RepID=UPI0025C5B777|nr:MULTISPECIES: hypothetical protein [unclassified Archaeoglobus]
MKAQAFTLEGVMASLLLLVVLYSFFQSTIVISPMWSEITDAQLKLIGYDTLKVLDYYRTSSDEIYPNQSLQGMIVHLNSTFKPNQDFIYALERMIYLADYRLELCWANLSTNAVECRALVDKKPTPEAVAASRIVVIDSGEFPASSPFYGRGYPIVFEVRLILWRP